MTSEKHKAEELLVLNRFRAVSGELLGRETRGDDPPDFVIEAADGRITIEMTRYHQDAGGPHGSALALQESAERSLRSLAQQSFERVHPELYVSISPFFREGALSRANVPRYAEGLASLIANLVPPRPTELEPLTMRDATWEDIQSAGLDQAIVGLRVWRHIYMREGDWRVHPGGHLSRDTGHLLSRIQAKEHDLTRYRRPGDRSWLIVYSPILQASGFFDLEVLAPRMFASTFDTVVFIDVVWGRFVKVAERT